MEEAQIRKILEVTERQVGLLERCIADTRMDEFEFNPRIYRAMIAGYESQRDDLQVEARKYRSELGLD